MEVTCWSLPDRWIAGICPPGVGVIMTVAVGLGVTVGVADGFWVGVCVGVGIGVGVWADDS